MTSNSSNEPRRGLIRRFLRIGFLLKVGIPIALIVLLVKWWGGSGEETTYNGTTYTVHRGNLPITIVEGGGAESLEPRRIKCEVRGREVKILKIVEEGYRVTKEDIENKKVLVELDGSELEERIMEQEVQYQSAKASFWNAKQDYEIQEKQNESDIQAAEREVKFKSMDLKKYLGENLAQALMDDLHLRRAVEVASKNARDARLAVEQAKSDVEEKKRLADEAQAALDKMAKPAEGDVVEAVAPAAPDAGETKSEAAKEEGRMAEAEGAMKAAVADGERPKRAEGNGGRGPAEGGRNGNGNGGKRSRLDSKKQEAEDSRREEMKKAAEEAAAAAERADKTSEEASNACEKAVGEFLAAVDAAKVSPEKDDKGEYTFEVEFEPFDFPALAGKAELGGDAAQKKRTFETEMMLAEEDLKNAEKKLEGTKKLFEKDFVTETDLEREELAVTRLKIAKESKKIEEELFFRYEFPKQAEQNFSQYEEALRKYDRTLQEANTKLTNAIVNRDSAEARFKVQEKSRDEMREQLEKCTIYATHEGLVVYGGDDRYWRNEPIAEGTVVHEQMTILTIPDITQMAIKVQVHESAIKKISKGQQATVTVEAFPDEKLTGEVANVSVLPNSERRWMNPDLKTYETSIAIDGVYEWLKPGMTAEVEIFVKELKDIIYVPLQAVSSQGDERVCFLDSGERRVVETGEFSDKYIEIKSGLDDGDVIMLMAPESDVEKNGQDEDAEGEEGSDEKKEESAAPAAQSTPAPPPA